MQKFLREVNNLIIDLVSLELESPMMGNENEIKSEYQMKRVNI